MCRRAWERRELFFPAQSPSERRARESALPARLPGAGGSAEVSSAAGHAAAMPPDSLAKRLPEPRWGNAGLGRCRLPHRGDVGVGVQGGPRGWGCCVGRGSLVRIHLWGQERGSLSLLGKRSIKVLGDTRSPCGPRAAQAGAWPWDWPHALSVDTSHTRSLCLCGLGPCSPAGRAPEARAGGLQGKLHALVVRTCAGALCPLQGAQHHKKISHKWFGKLCGQGHRPGTHTAQGPLQEHGLGTATSHGCHCRCCSAWSLPPRL